MSVVLLRGESPSEALTTTPDSGYDSRVQRWVASGSFDRTIKLWDLHGGSSTSPLVTLSAPESSGPKASIYAMATDPYGSIVASGSPERVIRMWDPRSGKRVGKLVGHTDNIRAMLLSEDAKYVGSILLASMHPSN